MYQLSDDHPGTLHVDFDVDIELEVRGITKATAEHVLREIVARRSVYLTSPLDGTMYAIEGYSTKVARWVPDRAEPV